MPDPNRYSRFVELVVNGISRDSNGYIFDVYSGGVTAKVYVKEEVIDYIYEDFQLRSTPAPLLTQEQYKERMANEGILPEDL